MPDSDSPLSPTRVALIGFGEAGATFARAGGWPGDLGYWIGYRVAKSYYDRAPDKTAAIKAIIEMRDPAAFLAASGWVDTASP